MSRSERLSTAEESLEITESENVVIDLMNSFTVRLSEVLMISDIETNLLFIQFLIIQKIVNQQNLHEFKFCRNSKIVTKDLQHDKISYLS